MNSTVPFDPARIREMLARVNKSCGHSPADGRAVAIAFIDTDLGTMIAGATDKGICMLEYADYDALETELKQLAAAFKAPLSESEHVLFGPLRRQLGEYFRGERREFDIPLDPVGTDFQKQVWQALLRIPYGSTSSYAKQAQLVGNPSAVRAVANANGKNKISILLPCHRIIGSDGSLTGYGGELWRKKKLLDLELGKTSLL